MAIFVVVMMTSTPQSVCGRTFLSRSGMVDIDQSKLAGDVDGDVRSAYSSGLRLVWDEGGGVVAYGGDAM
jgi:hypothetical protein